MPKAKANKKVDSLLKRQILLEEQIKFYKKHSNAKTLIIIFILLVLILMWLYIVRFGDTWISGSRIFFLSKGMVQAGF